MAITKLPFATQPKKYDFEEVGTEETGILKIKVLKDLSPNERRFINDTLKPFPDLRELAVSLAEQIAESERKEGEESSLVDVYNALTAGDVQYLNKHLGKVIEFQKAMELYNDARTLALATAILRFRVMSDPDRPLWTQDDTGNADLVHPELVRLLAKFARKEENGGVDPDLVPAEPPTEEDLKKSQSEAVAEKATK